MENKIHNASTRGLLVFQGKSSFADYSPEERQKVQLLYAFLMVIITPLNHRPYFCKDSYSGNAFI